MLALITSIQLVYGLGVWVICLRPICPVLTHNWACSRYSAVGTNKSNIWLRRSFPYLICTDYSLNVVVLNQSQGPTVIDYHCRWKAKYHICSDCSYVFLEIVAFLRSVFLFAWFTASCSIIGSLWEAWCSLFDLDFITILKTQVLQFNPQNWLSSTGTRIILSPKSFLIWSSVTANLIACNIEKYSQDLSWFLTTGNAQNYPSRYIISHIMTR